tara:strand:- start:1114 stop:2034 length:921 start_codon:yes stop_codon:yes gene_type:complete
MKILYAGSSQSSSLILESLIAGSNEVIGVISQPDRRSKRGAAAEPSYVSSVAEKNNIALYKPLSLDENFKQTILKLQFDILLVVAYGKILPTWLLKSPSKESINIHYSLLPKYRGASPVQSALLNDEKITGISVMRMNDGLDEGPVYFFHKEKILEKDNKNTLEEKLTSLAVKNIDKDLSNIYLGKSAPIEQGSKNISYCKKIDKVSGKITLDQEETDSIFRKYKAYYGWPGLYFEFKGFKIKIHGIDVKINKNTDLVTNKFYFQDNFLHAKTVDGYIVITHLQFPGKGIISSKDAANSHANFFSD